MNSVRGTFKLATTKLRTRKLRLFITLVIASLLFGVLFFTLPVSRGGFSSIEQFGREGLGKRYVVRASLPSQGAIINNKTIMERALQINTDTITQKKAAAKKMGIPFDVALEQLPVTEIDTPTGKISDLNAQHPASKTAIKEYLSANPPIGSKELREAASEYQPTAFYESKQFQNGGDGGDLRVLKNGQEHSVMDESQLAAKDPLDAFNYSWTTLDNTLLQPFLLPGSSLDIAADGSIPLVVPFSVAESLLHIDPLPNNAAAQDTIKHAQDVRNKASSYHFEVCYRNRASLNLISQAVSVAREIERNKNNPDYQKPSLQYGLPKEACGASVVIRDTRTASEKVLDDKTMQLNMAFGAEQPVQQKLRFVIVGINPDKKGGNASNVDEIVGSVVNSSLGYGWYTPSSAEKQNPLVAHLFSIDRYAIGAGHDYYVEFSTATMARKFVNDRGCSVDSAMRSEGDNCAKSGKLFTIAAFGSNTVGLESLKQQFDKIFSMALLAVAAVASVVMGGTIGRIIADSRRETAVFRAIGAKRSNMAGIYLVYVTLLSLMIFATSYLIGTSCAFIVDRVFASMATANAVAVYSPQNTSLLFSLFSPQWQDALLIGSLILGVGYISAILPLIRNLKRSPIQDMRDDS